MSELELTQQRKDLTDLVNQGDDKDENLNMQNLTRSNILKVDVYMLPAKISYFFCSAVEAAFKPFMFPFLVGVGLNEAEAGLITGLRLLGMILAGPLWGFITDKRKNHASMLTLMGIFAILFVGGQPLLSVWVGDAEVNKCKVTTNQNTTQVEHGKQSHQRGYGSPLFLVLLGVNILSSCFEGCFASLVDAGVIQRINSASVGGKTKNFGWNRLFGGFGFSTGSFVSGLVSDAFPQNFHVNCYTGSYIIAVILIILLVISAPFLFRQTNPSPLATKEIEEIGKLVTENDETKVKTSISAGVRTAICNINALLFFSTVLITGMLQAVYISFTAIHLQDLNASTYLAGLTISLAALSCVPTFIFGSRIIELFGGLWNTLGICCFSYAIRYISLGQVSNPWLVIPISLLQSFGFGQYMVTAVLFIKSISNPGIYTTMYAITNTLFFGVGYIIVNIGGGHIYKRYRGFTVFTGFGFLALGWSIVIFSRVLYLRFYRLRRNRKERKETDAML